MTAQNDNTAWFIDSGATAHMTNRRELVCDMRRSNSATVTVANSTTLRVEGEGYVKLLTDSADVKIHKVLYVPDICANLLSVSAMVSMGLRLEFNSSGCKILNEQGVIQATATNINGMYRVNVCERASMASGSLVKQSGDTMLWHRRLGHAGSEAMRRMNAKWTAASTPCEVCVLGKHARNQFGESSTKTTAVLELVHTDVCGPMQVKSLESSKFFVTFIDDFSRRVVVYCVEKKSSVFDVFKQFKSRAEMQTGKKIRTIRSDNGTEYCNKEMRDFLLEAGIHHQTTVPYTPEQNGVAERMNRTLVEKARCMLFDAKLPMQFWAEAVVTAAYVVNRVPARKAANNKSPEELWTGKVPELKDLRVFGCKAMSHVPKEKRSKFDPKSKSCIFVGYSSSTKGFRLYDPVSCKFLVSRDVKFFEDEKGGEQLKVRFDDRGHFINLPEIRNEVEEMMHEPTTASGEAEAVAEAVSENEDDDCDEPDDSDEPDNFEDADYVPQPNVVHEGSAQDRCYPQRVRRPVDRFLAQAVEVTVAVADPVTPDEALSGPDADCWRAAMKREISSLKENRTWTLVDLPVGRKAIANKWVFKTKIGGDGKIDRYKARLVVKGCSQREGIDYYETFSPVVRYASIRYLVAMAARLDLDIDQMDVVTAFLQGDLNEEVYMKQPVGIEDGTSRVCRLQKSLYGLKQASRCWNQKLGAVLLKAGLKCSSVDTCIYYCVKPSDVLIVAVYVDDLMIFSSNQSSKQRIKAVLQKAFKMTDNGEARYILGMHIERNREAGTISIDQHKYLREVLQRFNMWESNPVSTPADVNAKLTKTMSPNDAAGREEMAGVPYQEAVGSVLFAAQVSRPDIQFAVNNVSRYNQNPGRAHWNAVKRIMRYLRGTVDMKLTYRRDEEAVLHGFCDADWANDEQDRRSITGYVFLLQGGAVAWNSRKQQTVALSTTEAEYMAMGAATQEAIWLKNLQNEVFGSLEQMQQLTIYGDNKSALMLGEKPTTFHPRTKHIDVRHHFIRDEVNAGRIKFVHTPTQNMTADVLTKAVPVAKHIKCRDEMNIH